MLPFLTCLTLLTITFFPSTAAQTVPVSIINQCSIPIQPQFLGTNNGIANPSPLIPGTEGSSVTLNFYEGFAGFIAASTGAESSVYGNASLIYVNLNTGNYWLSNERGYTVGVAIDPVSAEGANDGFCQPTACQDQDYCTTLARQPLQDPGADALVCPPQLHCSTLKQGFGITFCPGPRSPLLPPVLGPPACSTSNAARGVAINPNGNGGKCMDVRANERANGVPVQIYDCNQSTAQKWIINRGSGQVRLAGSNFCLDAGSYPGNGVGMKIWQCYDNLPAQNWYFTGDNRIAVTDQGQCLDLTDGRDTNFNQLQTWACSTGNTNQVWTANTT